MEVVQVGTNKIDANLIGKAGTETITGFATLGDSSTALVGATVTSSGAVSGTTIDGSGTITGAGIVAGANVRATNYVKVGAAKYIFSTYSSAATTIVAEATSVSASLKGSITLGQGVAWLFVTDGTASPINLD